MDDKEKDDIEEALELAEKAEEASEQSDDEPSIEQIKKPGTSVPEDDFKVLPKVEEVSEQEDDDEEDSQEKSNKNLFIWGGIVLVIIALLAGGFFFFSQRDVQKEDKVSIIIPTPSPTETPKRVLVKSDWSLEVLNGSGVSGLAKKVTEEVKNLDYQVVKTGNADKSNYQTTQIWIKNDLLDQADLIIDDLRDVIKIASVAGELKDSTASARIVIGQDFE